jgi:hypothetical protein
MNRHSGSCFHPRMRARVTIAILSVALATQAPCPPAHAASTSIPPASQPLTGPETAIRRYASAFTERSADGIGAVLTADYRFHQKGDALSDFLSGKGREVEMAAVRGLLQGVQKDGATVMPAAESLSLLVDGVSQRFDPEHPDSTEHYRVLTVKRFDTRIVLPGGQVLESMETLNTFHVVRGDAAVLAEGQSGDPAAWYIRRWLSDVTGVITAIRDRGEPCGEPDPRAPDAVPAASSTPQVPTQLALRPLLNPACALLTMTCDLPGTEPANVEVYDVSGRRVHQRQVPVKSAGVVTVDAGRGARIIPGVYWVRLSQAARRPSTRMVVVSR